MRELPMLSYKNKMSICSDKRKIYGSIVCNTGNTKQYTYVRTMILFILIF